MLANVQPARLPGSLQGLESASAVIEPFKGNYQTHEDTNGDTFTIIKFIEHKIRLMA
jgi:hypothetical protein